MVVLLVSQEMPPETGWGGIGTYVEVLAPALAAAGAEVHVLSVAPGQPRGTSVRDGVHVHRAPLRRWAGAGRLTGLPQTVRRAEVAAGVLAELRRLPVRPDVVEAPEWMAEGLGIALRRTAPLVVRLHSSARQLFPFTGQGGGRRGRDGRWAVALEEAAIRRADVVTTTQANHGMALDGARVDPSRVRVIAHPVVPRPPAPWPDGPPRIVFAGRLEPRKAPEVVVRALPRVLEAAPDARLVVLGRDAAPGTPSGAGALRALADDVGAGHALELLGHRDREAVAEEMRRAWVVAVPSLWESFGNTVAEAATSGRPVVGSDIPPFRELIVDGVTGRIVPPGDADAWGTALAQLVADGAAARAMGIAGARHVTAHGDLSTVARLTLDAYATAAASWATARPAARRRT